MSKASSLCSELISDLGGMDSHENQRRNSNVDMSLGISSNKSFSEVSTPKSGMSIQSSMSSRMRKDK